MIVLLHILKSQVWQKWWNEFLESVFPKFYKNLKHPELFLLQVAQVYLEGGWKSWCGSMWVVWNLHHCRSVYFLLPPQSVHLVKKETFSVGSCALFNNVLSNSKRFFHDCKRIRCNMQGEFPRHFHSLCLWRYRNALSSNNAFPPFCNTVFDWAILTLSKCRHLCFCTLRVSMELSLRP